MLEAPSFVKKQILFAFLNQGDKLTFQNDNVVIRDAENKIRHQSTCYRLFALYVVGHTTLTTGLIQRAAKFGFSIIFLTGGFRIYHRISSRHEGNTLLHRMQYQYTSLDLARHILSNKIRSQRTVLHGQREKSPALKAAIRLLDEYLHQLPTHDDLNALMGVEGAAARIYFPNHFNDIPWTRRQPRVKADWINSLLDIGYTILFTFIESLLEIYGFDLYCGVMHKEFYMRKSLVCDLVEPFRPLIDQQIKKSIHLRQFQEKDFTVINHSYQLEWKHSPRYSQILLQAILKRREEIFKYIQSYYRAFMRQKPISQYPIFEIEKE
ncbi:MAG: type V CRISPR-associated endonuclease Cas1 [Planctomycetia bacterium]|nr:type V CRISPR-associated endonuclease Cas1 [Planctomycetia bacterium]